jgi:hypothetical protein
MSANKLMLKGFTLMMLLLSLVFFSRESTKSLLASAQTGQGRSLSPTISISPQEDGPLRIISTLVVSAEPQNFRLQVMIQNQSLKGIRAYALTSETASDKKQNGYTDFQNFMQQSGIWQPASTKIAEVSDTQSDPIVSVRLTIDFVEYTDGTTWGPNTQHSSDILAGQREGARIERQRIRQLLKGKGPKAVIDDIQVTDFSKDEALVGNNHSDHWLEGFHSGVSSIRRRLKQLYPSSDMKQIETELSKPFDTSEENQR